MEHREGSKKRAGEAVRFKKKKGKYRGEEAEKTEKVSWGRGEPSGFSLPANKEKIQGNQGEINKKENQKTKKKEEKIGPEML